MRNLQHDSCLYTRCFATLLASVRHLYIATTLLLLRNYCSPKTQRFWGSCIQQNYGLGNEAYVNTTQHSMLHNSIKYEHHCSRLKHHSFAWCEVPRSQGQYAYYSQLCSKDTGCTVPYIWAHGTYVSQASMRTLFARDSTQLYTAQNCCIHGSKTDHTRLRLCLSSWNTELFFSPSL